MTLAHFLIHSSWLWQAFIGLDIPNGQLLTGSCFIISICSWQTTRAADRRGPFRGDFNFLAMVEWENDS